MNTLDRPASDQSRAYWWSVFFLLLALCVVLSLVLVRVDTEAHQAVSHPTQQDMLVGANAAEGNGELLFLGGFFGLCQMALFVLLLVPGILRNADRAKMKSILWITGIIYLTAFVTVLVAYHFEIHANDASEWKGFPFSTWFALFVFWPIPIVFIVAYTLGFKRFILSEMNDS